MSEAAIRVHGLTRVFQTAHGPVRALDDLSLEIGRGRIFGFLGPNGAGKTTTFRLLLGLIEPTAGSATVLGHDAATDGAGVRARAGALLEHDGLYERLTAQENLEYYGRIWRLRAGERADRIRELLKRFGLWDRRDDPIGTWSRGMKRKLALSRALLHRPELILLDEPTAGLDPGAAATLRDDLAGLSAHEHATIFINTHNLAEAEVLCDTVGVIAGGKLRACGSPHSLRSEFESHHVEISGRRFDPAWTPALAGMAGIASVTVRDTRITAHAAPTTSLAPLVRFLVEQGAEIEEVRRDHATLEDVYLQLTGAAA